jgi:carbon starvation protein CstA
MDVLLLVLISGAALLLAYFTYGRWLSRRIFNLDENAETPAITEQDGKDFVPTAKSIVFGHHFTSIAGTGPIVGPAIAVMWGWLPAILWVVIGCIFIGAVHDLGSLVVSLRNKGRSIGDVAGDILGPRVRLLFLAILIVGLWIVLAVFSLVIASVLRMYPAAITPVLIQIPLAVGIGVFVHRKGRSIVIPSVIALAVMYASVVFGDVAFLHTINETLAAQPLWAWTIGLLAYAYVASVLPVWTLLQPRDYINALQLISCLVLITVGLVVAAIFFGNADPEHYEPTLEIVAPMIDWHPTGAPPMLPVLFITIACGACSGFHCLVASGTTSKQVTCETHAKPIAYGSMLTEGFLATLVIAACAAGIGLGKRIPIDARVHDRWMSRVQISPLLEVLVDTSKGHPAVFVSTPFELPDSNAFIPNPKIGVGAHLHGEYLGRRPSEQTVFRQIELHKDLPSTVSDPRNSEVAEQIKDWLTTHEGYHWIEGFELNRAMPINGGYVEWIQPSNDLPFAYLSGPSVFHTQYSSWSAAGSLGAKVGAFVQGAANFLAAIGIPLSIAIALMGVMVASFAATTMDTACRLQRYVIQELASTFLPKVMTHSCRSCTYDLSAHLDGKTSASALESEEFITCPECAAENTAHQLYHHDKSASRRAASFWNLFKHLATVHGAILFAVITAALLAFIPAPGQGFSLASAGSGGLILWPLFGATNQLLAGFAFVVIGAWLISKGKPIWFLVLPAIIMLAVPAWAMSWQAFIGNADNPSWLSQSNWLLVGIASVSLVLEAWLLVEVYVRWMGERRSDAPQRNPIGD